MTDTERDVVERVINDPVRSLYLTDDEKSLFRALLAAKEGAEVENTHLRATVEAYADMAETMRKRGGPGVMRRQMEVRRYRVRAEAAEAEAAELREGLRDAIDHLWQHEPYPKPCYQRCRDAYLSTNLNRPKENPESR